MAEVQYAARIPLPYIFERGRNTLAQCPVYRNNALAVPTSGTVSLYDPSGTAVVSAASVTITNSVAERTVTSASLASYSYGDGWYIEWALVMPDGVTHTFRASAALVRAAWHPTVSDVDLFARMSSLNPANTAPVTTLRTYQPYIDEAAIEIQRRLIQAGRRPWLIVDTTELREPHLLLSLTLISEDFATRLNPAWIDMAKSYRQQWEASWGRVKLTLTYDNSSGIPDTANKKSARPSGFWTMSRN